MPGALALLSGIVEEAWRSYQQYGDFASSHEAYGVLAEEVAELFDAVRLNGFDPTRGAEIRKESIQVAAVAFRLALQAEQVTR